MKKMFEIIKYCSLSEIERIIQLLEQEESNGSLLARFALIEFRQYRKLKFNLNALHNFYKTL